MFTSYGQLVMNVVQQRHRCLLLSVSYDCCLATPNPQMFPFQLANSQCTVVYPVYHKVIYLRQNVVYLHEDVVQLQQNVVQQTKSQMFTFARLAQQTPNAECLVFETFEDAILLVAIQYLLHVQRSLVQLKYKILHVYIHRRRKVLTIGGGHR